ncbi:hypothetical protein F5883DRAFT_255430 [Diaporthe sp. PMI_573]|nr:hypothetical protein F5883DRAFT_255430 [Diaporthaceae sp. PMI_573]
MAPILAKVPGGRKVLLFFVSTCARTADENKRKARAGPEVFWLSVGLSVCLSTGVCLRPPPVRPPSIRISAHSSATSRSKCTCTCLGLSYLSRLTDTSLAVTGTPIRRTIASCCVGPKGPGVSVRCGPAPRSRGASISVSGRQSHQLGFLQDRFLNLSPGTTPSGTPCGSLGVRVPITL